MAHSLGEKKDARYLEGNLKMASKDGEAYQISAAIVGVITFIITYIWSIVNYGFLFGVGLGWLPSMILAVVVGFLWPVILFVFFIGVLFILYANKYG